MFVEKTEVTYSIPIETQVEYKSEEYIGNNVDFLNEFDSGTKKILLIVSGKKTNKTGEFIVRDFAPVPAYYFVKDISETLGFTGSDDG